MKQIKYLIYIISFLIILVLIYFSFFNNFQSDDFWYAESKYTGVLEHAKKLYFNQGGRYFSYSLNAAVPIDWYFFPKIYSAILMMIFIFSITININIFFKIPIILAFVKAISFFFIYVSLLLSISEHLYWYSGINVYFLPVIITSFFIYFYKKYILENKNVYLLLIYVLGILIVGSNEVLAILFYISLLLDSYYNRSKWKLILNVVLSLFIAINFLAPGNFIRLNFDQKTKSTFLDFVLLRGYAFITNSIWVFLKALFLSPLILFLFNDFFIQIKGDFSPKKSLILMIPPFFVILFLSLIFEISARANDTLLIYFAFTFSFILSYFFNPKKYLVILCLIIVFLPKVYLFPKRDNLFMINYNNFNILNEILFTNLKEFDNEVRIRRIILETSKKNVILLEPIHNKPNILYFEEMGTKEKPNYINEYLKKYYKKEIFVKYKIKNKK